MELIQPSHIFSCVYPAHIDTRLDMKNGNGVLKSVQNLSLKFGGTMSAEELVKVAFDKGISKVVLASPGRGCRSTWTSSSPVQLSVLGGAAPR